MSPTFASRCVFTAAVWHGRWWLDRVNPHGRTEAVCGPFRTEIQALQRANEMNRINQGWEMPP
jgi:hypothetical protein